MNSYFNSIKMGHVVGILMIFYESSTVERIMPPKAFIEEVRIDSLDILMVVVSFRLNTTGKGYC